PWRVLLKRALLSYCLLYRPDTDNQVTLPARWRLGVRCRSRSNVHWGTVVMRRPLMQHGKPRNSPATGVQSAVEVEADSLSAPADRRRDDGRASDRSDLGVQSRGPIGECRRN